jgi:osmotically-inducible protein OsmY
MYRPSLLPCLLSCVLLALLPSARAGILEDRKIEDAIDSSYVFSQLLTDRSMVLIHVRHGAVELRGQVADERERRLLTYAIAAIPDVKQVENLLFVDSAGKRDSSRWRAQRIRAELLTQADVDVRATRITYSGERWEFTGTVANPAQVSLVAARVAALSAADPLHVNLELAAPGAAPVIDDASIVAMVRIALERLVGETMPLPEVSCVNGVVLIRGSLSDRRNLDEAARLAAAIRGVKSVDNRMAAAN